MPARDAYIPESAPRRQPTAGLHLRGAGRHQGCLGGRVVAWPDIAAHVVGDAGRRYDEKRIAGRRREQARVLIKAALGTNS